MISFSTNGKFKNRKIRWPARVLALCLLALLSPGFSAAQQPAAPPPKRPRTDNSKKPEPPPKMTYSKIAEGVEKVVNNTLDESVLIQFISTNGIDFPATEETLGALRKQGASDALIDAIIKVSPPLPPPPPPKRPSGALSIECAPAECEIKYDGKPYGSTERGVLQAHGLETGQAVIDFSKKGYVTRQETVQIAAGVAQAVSVTLEPDYTTKAELGSQLWKAALRANGLNKEPEKLWVLTGTGSATSFEGPGKQSEWTITFEFGQPNLLKMEAASPDNGTFTLLCRGEHCEPKKKGALAKRAKNPAALDALTANLRQYARYHPAALLGQLLRTSNQFLAPSFDDSGEKDQHLAVEAIDISYDVTVGPRFRPGVILCNPKSGLGAGFKVTFGDYTKVGDFQYPARTTVTLPGGSQQGIQVRFETIKQESALRDKDFPQ